MLKPKPMDPGSQNALEMVRALRIIKKVFLTENGALPTKAYREDGDETLDPGSKAYREDAGMDPGSQSAFEMVRAL